MGLREVKIERGVDGGKIRGMIGKKRDFKRIEFGWVGKK